MKILPGRISWTNLAAASVALLIGGQSSRIARLCRSHNHWTSCPCRLCRDGGGGRQALVGGRGGDRQGQLLVRPHVGEALHAPHQPAAALLVAKEIPAQQDNKRVENLDNFQFSAPDSALVLSPGQHIEYVRDLCGAARQSDRRCNGDMC